MKSVVLVALLALSGNAVASQVVGAGVKTCGDYIADEKKSDEMATLYIIWLQGSLSATNAAMQATRGRWEDIPSADTLKLWLHNHCRSNPLDQIFTASVKLFQELDAQQYPTK